MRKALRWIPEERPVAEELAYRRFLDAATYSQVLGDREPDTYVKNRSSTVAFHRLPFSE